MIPIEIQEWRAEFFRNNSMAEFVSECMNSDGSYTLTVANKETKEQHDITLERDD